MLMFNFHITFSLALIALALGAALLIWSKVHAGVGTTLAKAIGYIVIIAAGLNALCSGYYAVKYRAEGYFDKPFPPAMMHDHKMMMSGQMMPMMPNMKCPMMPGKMMGGNKMMENKNMQKPMSADQMAKESATGMQKSMPNNTAEHEEHHK